MLLYSFLHKRQTEQFTLQITITWPREDVE